MAEAVVALDTAGPPRPAWLEEGEAPDDEKHRGSTDEDGCFAIPELPADTVNIKAVREGFLPILVRHVDLPPGAGAADLGTLVLVTGASLAGRAVDVEGQGLAEVALHVVDGGQRPDDLGEAIRRRLADKPPAVVTDASGSFKIDGLLPGERVHLLAERRGYSPFWLKDIEPPIGEPLIFNLEAAFAVSGQVVDEAGEPIGDAELRLEILTEPPEKGLPPRPERRLQRSDNDGRFVIEDAPAGAAELRGYARGFVPFGPLPLEIPTDPRSTLTVVLDRGAVLEGRIETDDGEPVAGARVVTDQHRSFADAEGFYRIAGLAPGANRLEASHPHYESQIRSIDIEPGLNTLNLTFAKGQTVNGLVVDEDGRPIAGARVALSRQTARGTLDYWAMSAADGSFVFAEVADGEYGMDVERQGFAPLWMTGAVRVTGEPVTDLELVLERGTTVSGRVLGLDFEEMSRLRVEAGSPSDRTIAGKVDYAGGYEIDDLPKGNWLVRASLPGGRREVQARLSIEPGEGDLTRDLIFDERLTLSGRVLQGGEPVPGTVVSLKGYEVAVRRSVRTNHLGEFRIEDLAEGSYRLGLSNARELLIHHQELHLVADRELDIHLEPARVGGTVRDEDAGAPIAGAQVILRKLSEARGGEGMLAVGTDAAGEFYFPPVPSGRYRVTVRKDGYAGIAQELDVAAGSELHDLLLEIRATRGLTLEVRLAAGGSPPFVRAVVLGPSGSIVSEESRAVDALGRARLPSLSAGRFELMVSAPGTVSETVSVEVPGEPVPIVLASAGRIDVQVPALATSDRLAALHLVRPGGGSLHVLDALEGLTKEWLLTAGTTRVEGVPPGFWELQVVSVDGQIWSGNVAVLAGASTEVVLE